MIIDIKMIYLILIAVAFMSILCIMTIKKILSIRSRFYYIFNVYRRNNRSYSLRISSITCV